MAKIAVMTQLSPTMKEGVFVEWLKNEGDSVRPGDTLASIETDKAVMELEAFDSGVLLKKIAQKGDKIPVGAPIGILGNAGENIDTLLADLKTSTPKPAALPPLPPSTKADLSSGTEKLSTLNHNNTGSSQSNLVNETPPFPPHGRIVASPLAKKRAAQEGIDLTRIQGTGPGGRIVNRDLTNAPFLSTASAKGERLPDARLAITPMRQTIAERLTQAKQTVPHFYLSRCVNVTRLIALRHETNAALATLNKNKPTGEINSLPDKVSMNDYILAAVAQTLRLHTEFLRQWMGDHILERGNVDLGFAVSLDEGLITPVIRNADHYNLFELVNQTRALSTRARGRKLKLEEYTGGCFTVTNLGMLGITSFQAIINAPEAAILAVGTTERRAYEDKNGGVAFGDFLTLNLACDHRIIDGAVGAQFLATLAQYLENPALIR